MRRLVVLCLLLLALGGCREEDTTPVPAACSDVDVVVSGLESAPQAVLLEGVPLSDCFASERPSGGDVQAVGATMLAAARRLSEEGRALELGYLVGSLKRDPDHRERLFAEVVRRVEQEALPLIGSARYQRGLRAGRTSG